jgi:hypothetical protein
MHAGALDVSWVIGKQVRVISEPGTDRCELYSDLSQVARFRS